MQDVICIFTCSLGFGLCLITFNFRCFQFTNLLARLNQFPDVLTFCFTFIFYLPKSISFCRFLLPLLLQCLLTSFLLFSLAFISFSFVAHLISFSFQKNFLSNNCLSFMIWPQAPARPLYAPWQQSFFPVYDSLRDGERCDSRHNMT